jgi:hypothetical protein
MWIRINNRVWCHDLIWGPLWIATDVKDCSYDIFWSDMKIGNYVTESYHDQFEIICGLEQMIEDDVWPNEGDIWKGIDYKWCCLDQFLQCYVDRQGCYRKLSRPIWSTMWIRSDDRVWCHDLLWGDIWIGTDDKGCWHDEI